MEKGKNNSPPAFSVIVVFVALMIIGSSFIPSLDIRFMPGNRLPEITVSFSWPGASPRIVEQEASKIEGLLGKISQVKSIESNSSVGYGSINLTFDKTADIDKKRYEVAMLIRQARSNLPEEMSYPEITAGSAADENQTSFMTLTLNANASTYYIREVAEKTVIPALARIDGVSDISTYGVTPYQWEISFNPAQLSVFSVTPSEISTAINRLGENMFLGNQQSGLGASTPVLLSSQFIDPPQWGAIPIARKNGRIVKLADVASVRLNEKEPTSYYRINGQNTVNLVLSSAQGINQMKLSSEITEVLESIKPSLPPGYVIRIASDSTIFIKEELTRIGLRTFFSLLILLLFVLVASRSFRILSILFISLVANLLIAVVFYYLLKIEIHLYSLAAVTVSFGMIIDNSIIMVTHLQKQKGMRVFVALLAATLTTLGALSVVFFLKENQRALLTDFIYVMIINLSVSLVVSFTLVPALMKQIYHRQARQTSIKTRRRVFAVTGIYGKIIGFERRYKWAFILLALFAFGLPVWKIPGKTDKDNQFPAFYNKTLGSDYFQNKLKPVLTKIFGGTLRLFSEDVFESNFYSDPGQTILSISGKMPEGCTVQQLNESVKKMEQFVSLFDEVEQFETRVSSYRSSMITVRFTKEAERSSFPYLLKSQVEQKVNLLGGMDWTVYGVGRGFSNSLNTDYRSNHILLTGYNYEQLYRYAEQLEKDLLQNPRVEKTEISSSQSWYSSVRYEYNLGIDKTSLAYYNLSYQDYTSSLFSRLYGRSLNSVYYQGELQPVVLRSSENNSYNKWDFYNHPSPTAKGQKKLSQAGQIDKILAGKTIYKKGQVYQLSLNYNFNGPGPLAKMVEEKAVDELNKTLPLGYKAQRSQSYYMWDRNESSQYWLLLLVIAIIYFICAILFESLLKPLAVILTIPLSFIGVFLTFYLFGFNFDQGGFASFILLSGLVVNAAIYIINDYNNLITRRGWPASLATYLRAFNQKIVPILLTVLSTVLGLVPFVWGGQNEVFWFAFAAGAMGGLVFSMVGIVFYLPLFLRLDVQKGKSSRIKRTITS